MPGPIDPTFRPTLTLRETSPRMTAPPAGRTFTEALGRSGRALLETAISAAAQVPGGPALSAALRGAVLPLANAGARAVGPHGTAEAPVAMPAGGTGSVNSLASGGSGGTGASSSAAGGDDMLARGQEMSMQMLRLQEAVSEENRRYTALSNVLHARHEMAKNAIGNIR